MKAMDTVIDLRVLSRKLLDSHLEDEEAKIIIDEIYAHFKEITSISGYDSDISKMIALPARKGMALSVNHAAQCLLDYHRTRKFLKGFYAAIVDKQKDYPNETIQIFYAGCGPYAPFLTLIASLFNPEEIQFSLLEINKDSLEKAELLIERLELTNYVTACFLSDATTFKIKKPNQYHILFSETLDALLYRECYVPILWNLLPQLPPETAVIPENVKIDLYFKERNNEVFDSTIFDVRKRVKTYLPFSLLPGEFKSTIIPLNNKDKYDKLLLTTEVQIYKEHNLTRDESSLSKSLEIQIEKPITHKAVYFTYYTSPNMELKYALRKQ